MKQSDLFFGKKFHQVICERKTAKNRICGQYLGVIEISRPNISFQYCRRCKIMEAWIVGEDGKITVLTMPRTFRLKVYDEAVILREQTDA